METDEGIGGKEGSNGGGVGEGERKDLDDTTNGYTNNDDGRLDIHMRYYMFISWISYSPQYYFLSIVATIS
jgi:hypothetical protein